MIAVWFSCGVASAVAAKRTLEMFPNEEVRVVYNPVAEEHSDNLRFLQDVSRWLGQGIEIAGNPEFPDSSIVSVFDRFKFMSGPRGARCTVELKKKARQKWEQENRPDSHVLGFTYDEVDRHLRFTRSERENVIPVLIRSKLTKADCFEIVASAGIKPPEVYKRGFPNANCVGCVKATSPTYWNLVRREFPAEFHRRAVQSRQLGVRLVRVKGERIFLDELDPSSRGREIKLDMPECGIFCEEKNAPLPRDAETIQMLK